MAKNVNIIHINQMINSAIQQGSEGSEQVILSKDQADEITGFLSSIDGSVELMQIEHALINGKSNAKNLIQAYHNKLLNELKTFKIDGFKGLNRDNPWGDKVCEVVEQMTPTREKFIRLYKIILDNNSTDIDVPKLLEQLLQFNFQDYDSFQQRNTSGFLRNDNYRVFIYEVFLYTIAYLLREQKYTEIQQLISRVYQIQIIHNENSSNPIREYKSYKFPRFNYAPMSINDELRRNHHNIYLDHEHMYRNFLMGRGERNDLVNTVELAEADILLYYVSLFHTINEQGYPHFWLPYFVSLQSGSLDLMLRSVSDQFFNKVIGLFGVSSKQEFEDILPQIIQRQREHHNLIYQYNIPELMDALNIHYLCTQP